MNRRRLPTGIQTFRAGLHHYLSDVTQPLASVIRQRRVEWP